MLIPAYIFNWLTQGEHKKRSFKVINRNLRQFKLQEDPADYNN